MANAWLRDTCHLSPLTMQPYTMQACCLGHDFPESLSERTACSQCFDCSLPTTLRPPLAAISTYAQNYRDCRLARYPPACDGLLPLAYTLTHGAAATMLLSPPQGVRSLRCACQAASHGSRQRSGMQQCAHIELALHCARQSFTSFKHHGRLGVHSKRARRAPGSTGTARLLVRTARRTAALDAVNAVLGPDERLPARPGGRG